MNKLFMAIGGLAALATAFAPLCADAEMRVGSYNIRYGRGDAGTENAWEGRRADLAALMGRMALDVVGLQEVEPDQAAYLTNALPQYAMVGEFRNADRASGEASPVMYLRSRFRLEKGGTFWLSETPDVPGSKGWGAACPRVCTWAVLVDLEDGVRFCFANTHTDHMSKLARREGMRLVVEGRLREIASGAMPVLLVGDHNCLETEEAAQIAARHMKNALYISETTPSGPWRTLNCWIWSDDEVPCAEAWRRPAEERNAPVAKGGHFARRFAFGGPRIDYIYVSDGIRVKSYATYPDARPGVKLYPSDHFPVAATVCLPPAPANGGVRMSAVGDCRLPARAHVVSGVPGYNSWPMIQSFGDWLFCAYSRDSARPANGHTIHPGSRDSYLRRSPDGGCTWSDETVVANDPLAGEVNEGIGLDETGAVVLWVRCLGGDRRHELYRTIDGRSVEKVAVVRPDPFPMQVMDPVRVEGLGLVSPWFAGNYRKDGSNSWGLLVSTDNGRTWSQRVIEKDLSVKEWVTEPSLVDLGGGRLLFVGRCEQGLGTQFQVTSADGGKTWKKSRTNIGDVRESTPSLVYDAKSGLVANYYYHRGARKLKRRVADADFIFDHPDRWPEPEVLDEGFEQRAHDAGNVKATRLGDKDCCAWYTGTQSNATVVVTVVPSPSAAGEMRP